MKLNDLNEEELGTLQLIQPSILIAIINKKLDMQTAARELLANRGLNLEGKWVGFEKSSELLLGKAKKRKRA